MSTADAEFERELEALLSGELPPADPGPPSLPPAVKAMRAVHVGEALVGLRARFQMTSVDGSGGWLDYGWRDGLRVISEPTGIDGIHEPAVWVQEEADYYRSLAGTQGLPRFGAGVSRLWVEEYVSQEALGPPSAPLGPDGVPLPEVGAWVASVVSGPDDPRITRPIPARDAHAFIGRRAIVSCGSTFETDLRIIDQPTVGWDGTIALSVVDESDWFAWTTRPYRGRHPSMRAFAVEHVWVES